MICKTQWFLVNTES